MPQSPKKRRWLKVILVLVGLGVVGLITLYYLIQSPSFLRFAIRQLNKSIAGEISYQSFLLDVDQRTLKIRGLVYENDTGQKIISLDSLDMNFDLSNAVQGRLGVDHLRAEGLLIDQRNSPKSLKPSSWRTALRVVLKRLYLQDSVVKRTDLYLRNGDEFHFDEANLALTSQRRSRQEVNVWVNQATLKPGKAEIKTGRLAFAGKVTIPVLRDFTFFVSEAEGTLELDNVEVGKLPPSSFKSGFKIGGDALYLENGRFLHPQGTLSVDVDYIPAKSSYKVDLKTMQPFPFSAIPRASKELLETFDKFEMSLRAELQGFKLEEMNGKVELSFKTLGNAVNRSTPANKLDLKGPIKNGVLRLEQFKLSSAKSLVTATGDVDFAKRKFNTKIDAKQFDLQTMVEALSDIGLQGYVNAQGTIAGDFKSPTFHFKAQAPEAGYSFLKFENIAGDFDIQNDTLTFKGGLSGGEQSATVDVRTDNIFKKNKHTVLKTQFNSLDTAKLTDNPDLKGRVSGSFDMEDFSETPPTGKLTADIPDFWVMKFHIGKVHAEGKLANQKFVIAPLTFQPPNFETLTLAHEVTFSFDEKGVKLKGEVLPGALVEGDYLKAQPTRFNINASLSKADIRPVLATLELPPYQAFVDGKIRMAIGLENHPTEIDLKLDRFTLPLEEGAIENAEPVDIAIRPPKVDFRRLKLKVGNEILNVGGFWTLNGGFNLDLRGKMDLSMLKLLPKMFREGSGEADVDLKVRGTEDDPRVTGDIVFKDAAVTLRVFRGQIEGLNGRVKLSDNAVIFNRLGGSMAEGDIMLDGRIDLKALKPSRYDLKIEAREATVTEPGTYKLVFSGDFSLRGPAENVELSGKLFLTEGRYIRNFSISDFVLKPAPKTLPSEPNPFLENLHLNLEVKSSGELLIRNNVAEMYLQSDLRVKGVASHPKVTGALEILEGKFKYFRIEFDDAKGIVDFRDPNHGPYVDVVATKEFTQRFTTATVTAHILGPTDNLQLNFTSDVGLDRRQILSLIFTGNLPGEGPGLTGTQVATGVVTSQLSGILGGTLADKAQLDIFKFEASDPDRKNLSTLIVGKRITERLSLEFKTDLGVDDPLQGVQMEYLLLDDILMEASQLTDGSFDMNLAFRWKWF